MKNKLIIFGALISVILLNGCIAGKSGAAVPMPALNPKLTITGASGTVKATSDSSLNTFVMGGSFMFTPADSQLMISTSLDMTSVDHPTVKLYFNGNIDFDYYLNSYADAGLFVGTSINIFEQFNVGGSSDNTWKSAFGFSPNKLRFGYGGTSYDVFLDYRYTRGVSEKKHNYGFGHYIGIGTRISVFGSQKNW